MAARFEEPDAAWKLDCLSEAFRRPSLKNIVGVTLLVDRGEAKQKLSQNRSTAERRRVAEELRLRGDGRLADAIEALLSDRCYYSSSTRSPTEMRPVASVEA